MRIVKWFIGVIAFLFVVIILHYTLPSRDIVRIVGTDVKRMDVGAYPLFWANQDAGTNADFNRDVRFINANWANGDPRVYRNEDTDWSWPPYFKFDSGNLNAQAQGLAKEDDVWVAVTHYGWRIKLWSIFPNATSMKQVSGPDVFLFPWFNVIFLTILGLILFTIIRALRRFKERRIDPITDQVADVGDAVSDYADAASEGLQKRRSAVGGVWRRWFGSSK